jgi:glycolate oxidase
MLTPETAQQFEEIVGKKGMLLDPDQRTAYRYDVGEKEVMVPDAIVFPSELRHISAVVALANREHIHVLPEGAGTRRCLPFALERSVVLSTSKMGRILDMDGESLKVTLEAGTTLKMLQEALDKEGLYFPPYPWCFETSTVGGCAADGIGGPASCRHGVFKQYVLGMEVVLPSGEVTRIGGQTVKNVVGYDLTSLFCGSEGGLGVIGNLTLRLLPKPRDQRLLIAAFRSPASACAAMKGTMDAGLGPERICLLDNWMTRKLESFSRSMFPGGQDATVLCQIAGLEEVVESQADAFFKRFTKNGGTVIKVVKDSSEAEAIWHAQGFCLASINDAAPSLMTWDIVVPRSKAVAMMEKCEQTAQRRHVTLVHGGYYGNGIFHPVALVPDHDEAQRESARAAFTELVGFARSVGGNGAGPFRRLGIEMAKFGTADEGYLGHTVRAIKGALDPNGIMKPLPSLHPPDLKVVSRI